MTLVAQSQSPTIANSNTFSVLSAMTPTVQRPTVPVPSAVPLSSTQFSAARRTGLVSSNSPVVPSTTPVTVTQTVNSPTVSMPISRTIPTLPVASTTTTTVSIPGRGTPGVPMVSPTIPLVSTTAASVPIARGTPAAPISNVMIPRPAPSPQVTFGGGVAPISIPQAPASPTARSALLNLNANGGTMAQSTSVTIPQLNSQQFTQQFAQQTGQQFAQQTGQQITQQTGQQIAQQTRQQTTQESLLFPSVRSVAPSSSLPLKPTAELMNQDFEVRNYQGIISNASLENELLNAGYAPISKIVIRTDNGDKRTQYIKAINKKGQRVFIKIDVNGYTTARASDLTLIEAHNASIVPYSLKTGAYNCAGKDVCGVAFECGSDAVCVLTRAPEDLTPKEANFVFVEQKAPAAAATVETEEGTIMSYPVILLSEIRANPALVLANTDAVTRRLRNSTYVAELQELAAVQQAINNLNGAFVRFNRMREIAATKLNSTLTQLEQWNEFYMSNPPTTDADKDKFRKIQYNLSQRNEGISTLLRLMKKVADKKDDIDGIAKEINEVSDFGEREFANIDKALSD